MAADVSSVARLLRGEAGKKGGPEIVTMDLLGGCSGGAAAAEDEVVDLEVTVPAGWERRLDLLSGKTFLTRHPSVHGSSQDLNLQPPPAATRTSAAVCTLDMVRSALERAAAGRIAASSATPSTSSASTSSSSSSAGKRNRPSPPTTDASRLAATTVMRAAACPSCLTYVLIAESDPRCPRCSARVPPLGGNGKHADEDAGGRSKKPRIDLNAAADETE